MLAYFKKLGEPKSLSELRMGTPAPQVGRLVRRYKGVCVNAERGKCMAQFWDKKTGEGVQLGRYDTQIEAARALCNYLNEEKGRREMFDLGRVKKVIYIIYIIYNATAFAAMFVLVVCRRCVLLSPSGHVPAAVVADVTSVVMVGL